MEFEGLADEAPPAAGVVLATQEQVEAEAKRCYEDRSTNRRLIKMGNYILNTTTTLKGRCQAEDLLQEAVFAVLTGRRVWKMGAVDFVGLLIGVMKSLASNQDRSLKIKNRQVVLDGELRSDEEDGDGIGVVERYGSDEASPEVVLLDKEERAKEDSVFVVLRAQYASSDLAGLILDWIAKREGHSLAEIRAALDVTDREFWSAHRRLARAIDELSKNGMKS